MRISFIGGGIMAEAIIKSCLSQKILVSGDITVSDIRQHRLDTLKKEYNIQTTVTNTEAISNADVIVLAIKPQDLNVISKELKELPPHRLIISILAGIKLDNLNQKLNYPYLVRAMPNMPAQISEGISVWTATTEVTMQQKEQAKTILSAMGEEIYVDNEKYIDMATAVSGSGPAYIFLIIEALIDAGVHIGLPRNIAEKLVIETTIGSARAIKETEKHPAELRNMVTSPGGTTAEGILQLETGGLRSLLLRAVIAAYEKSQSLGTK